MSKEIHPQVNDFLALSLELAIQFIPRDFPEMSVSISKILNREIPYYVAAAKEALPQKSTRDSTTEKTKKVLFALYFNNKDSYLPSLDEENSFVKIVVLSLNE